MNWKNIKIKGCEPQRGLLGTYEYFFRRDLDFWVTVYVYEIETGSFQAHTDGIRLRSGHPEFPVGYGESCEAAISAGLEEFIRTLKHIYPKEIPQWGVVRKAAYDLKEDFDFNDSYPYEIKNASLDWREDKLKRNLKCGPYLEFQLEQDGSYTRWHSNSVFIGNAVFDPVYKTFCRNKDDFATFGHNVFSIAELKNLKINIQKMVTKLRGIDSLSDYLEKISPIYSYKLEPEKNIWEELRDASLEFLEEVAVLIDQGIKEKRCLFVLGI